MGILQLVIKQKKTALKEEKVILRDNVLNMIGVDEPMENAVKKYTEFIATAIDIFRSKELNKAK